MDELLALIGQHWHAVLLAPGGLQALGVWLIVWRSSSGPMPLPPLEVGALATATSWLLAITLLPLPGTAWPYDLDLPTLLLLIELPYLARVTRRGAQHRLITLLNTYPLLMLAIAALGQSAGTLVLHDINRDRGALHWIGLTGWALSLPPLLGIGPWQSSTADALDALRRVALLGLLVAAMLPAHDNTPWWQGAVALLGAWLPLALLDRHRRGDEQQLTAWQPWLCAALLVTLATVSLLRLAARLG
ncbi:hypothetical protein [Kallotenue papyrolyticum]|uniref:hypothetical protein n=1 Tax=Kallotenue papyrolyticum TaxID=1325125 RepID=UPI000492646F|nr:hypothetical protein [Kallotenue papyrolyticum]